MHKSQRVAIFCVEESLGPKEVVQKPTFLNAADRNCVFVVTSKISRQGNMNVLTDKKILENLFFF